MTNSIVSGAGILKSINIPGSFFVISLLSSSLINFFLSLIPFAFLMFFLGAKFQFSLLCIFPIIILFTSFTYGLGLMLASLNVFYRDVNMIWLSFSPAIFYATPVAYAIDIVPEKWRVYYKLNPLAQFMEAIHHVIYNGLWLSWTELAILLFWSCLSIYVGTSVYNKLEKGFVSNL
ncbi:ABC transporter permease [Flavobacterium sp.]|uniref:ABC transporter permease n=1 Tax=Flavobacterium sp. TaxID=239 RepID=UPI0025C3CFB3|nr:ABC transporter permease [Flavobacterium sp.]